MKSIIQKICIICGICLLVIGSSTLVLWQWEMRTAEKKADGYVNAILESIPNAEGAVLEERINNEMPILSIEGTDFIGVLEIPDFDTALPVCAEWNAPYKYPCRFSGNIYDRTIQIGATTQKGQLDYYRDISVGDNVYFTDMEGNRYAYVISDMRYVKKADRETLEKVNADLTLFVKNLYSLEYIIIYCDALS